MNCYTSRNCFACYGLQKHEYCILNKQYTKEAYYELLEKCITKMIEDDEWGEFFDPRKAHFPYNDSTANVWYPLTDSQAAQRGLSWQDESRRNIAFTGETYAPLPIGQYDESIIGEESAKTNIDACLAGTLVCRETGRPFRIIPQEILFYIENSIPLPVLHPDERRRLRRSMRDPRHMHDRECDKCSARIQTPYSPDRSEKIYCEECYRQEVY